MPLGIVSNSDFELESTNSGSPIGETKHESVKTVLNPDVMKAPDIHSINGVPVDSNGEILHNVEKLGMVITSDAIVKRLNVNNTGAGGRNEGDVNVPQSLRKLIGDTATFEGRASALNLASELGLSSASVSGYTNPNNSAMSEANKEDIFAHLASRKYKMSKKALNKLNLALTHIDETKLKDLGAEKLANVAVSMAQVAKHMEPKQLNDKVIDPVQFHFYAPQVRQENHYEVVTAKDNY